MESEILGRVPRGTKLTRSSDQGEWSIVAVDGVDVYVASRYLVSDASAVADAASEGASGQQTSDPVNQRHEVNADIAVSWNVSLSPEWTYAGNSKINSGSAVYYQAAESVRKDRTVCVNAGHGTEGGSAVKTLSHPDGTPKVTGGTTAAGAVYSTAVSYGMTFQDGVSEKDVTLQAAKLLRDELLKAGYDVLMIREEADVQLDNIARTVIANQQADCHIALHWDSTSSDKGAFYMSVPDVAAYRAMEPVASNWQKHHKLGDSLIAGLREQGTKIFSDGRMAMDLTQTSYSTIPSVDIELGDKVSDHSEAALRRLAAGLTDGVNRFFAE